jgi:hypothetical protein
MMEVKNIGNQKINLIKNTRIKNTNFWHILFFLGLKLKTKQCEELIADMNNNVVAAFDQK